MTNDKIPIGRYRCMRNSSGVSSDYVEVKMKDGLNITTGDIITLDMIEPYESEAVRKVKNYISGFMYSPPDIECTEERWIEHAREIVALVHEAEDYDE